MRCRSIPFPDRHFPRPAPCLPTLHHSNTPLLLPPTWLRSLQNHPLFGNFNPIRPSAVGEIWVRFVDRTHLVYCITTSCLNTSAFLTWVRFSKRVLLIECPDPSDPSSGVASAVPSRFLSSVCHPELVEGSLSYGRRSASEDIISNSRVHYTAPPPTPSSRIINFR